MHICIPVESENGLSSTVCPHFGSAPAFLIVDTVNDTYLSVPNVNQHHSHGMCRPLASLENHNIDGIIVRGIGAGALTKLNAAKINVYLSELTIVSDVITMLKTGRLHVIQPGMTCDRHNHDHS
jgi:predicted Fe-Mo cluster-binding NifX family protein